MLLDGSVVGYATYVIRRDVRTMSVNKLAVATTHRRCGFGRSLIRHLIQLAKCRPRGEVPLEVVCLSSLPTSVGFYKACGFREDPTICISASGDFIEGQVYMEHRLRTCS